MSEKTADLSPYMESYNSEQKKILCSLLQRYSFNMISVFVVALVASLSVGSVYAHHDSDYGGGYGNGEVKNKTFRVDKDVRIEGDKSWKDKVTDVEEDDIVEFKIQVENVGEVGVDDMKYEDFLPDEMDRVGGSGLTEYWDDFEPGDEEEFIIKAKIKSKEFDRDSDFYKCVVNKVEITYDDDFEGSDTATVCYGPEEIKELPETGNVGGSMAGLGLIYVGLILKRVRKEFD